MSPETEIWVEKYRPRTLKEVVGQEEVVQRLMSYVERKNIPHLLFAGPPGTGKTASAIALTRDLFGEHWRDNFIEMNASVTPDTQVLVKIKNTVKLTNFDEIDKLYFKSNKEKYVVPVDLKALSFNGKIDFYPVSFISRHEAESIIKIIHAYGFVKVTLNHSVMVLNSDGKIIPVKASELRKGDYLIKFNKNPKSGFLPSFPFVKFFKKIDGSINTEWKFLKKRKFEKKLVLLDLLKSIEFKEIVDKLELYFRLLKLVTSELCITEIKDVKWISYNGWVYDFSVPLSEVFWGGSGCPILLHNSDERGIDVVRHKIKEFARTAPIGDAPFKIIFLDEADALTADAQAALRRTMEMYSRACRFILSCNYVSKIIEPIQSRCAVFRFRPVPPEAMKKRLLEICEKENVKITDDGLEALIYIANGDFRKAINALQGAAALGEVISAETIYQVTATARPEELSKILQIALEGKFMEARDLLDKLMIEYGMSGEDIVSQLFREILNSGLDEKIKVMLIDKLGEIDFRLTEGAHERIQLDAYLAYLATIKKSEK
ncbi:replication factor C small subunit [Candidatus Bathyarchaeota archaeon]|nr:MAG: replication factor C small subunit [Candidatus Bathyarchaeota archaeon]